MRYWMQLVLCVLAILIGFSVATWILWPVIKPILIVVIAGVLVQQGAANWPMRVRPYRRSPR